MKNNIYALVIFFAIVFMSCEKIGLCKDEDLHFDRTEYVGDELRIDGYYFGDIDSVSSLQSANIYYFYLDGTFFTSLTEDLDKAESGNIDIDEINEFAQSIKDIWGVYRIEGNSIEISRWRARTTGCETTFLERGEILNDTTFVLDEDRIFRFRPLEQKPDSTNSFID